MIPKRQQLLGRLAELSWFTRNGEIAATRSLAMLMEEPALRDASISWLNRVTGVDLSATRTFFAEQVHDDGARPDLEGLDLADRPLVVVEAKFRANLSSSQIESYLADQARRLGEHAGGPPGGVFVLLVPEIRVSEARFKLDTTTESLTMEGHAPMAIASIVVTWDDWLQKLDDALVDEEQTSISLSADLAQFRALCLTLGGLVIGPLGEPGVGADWQEKLPDYRVIVDHVTGRLSNDVSNRTPIGDEREFLARRYFPSGFMGENGQPSGAASVGVQARFADEGESPIWLRFNTTTPNFASIRDRILASDFRDMIRRDNNHLWLPLNVRPELSEIDLVEDLISQVRSVQAVLGRPQPA